MTSTFDNKQSQLDLNEQKIKQKVNSQLDDSIAHLSQQVQGDIAQARMKALAKVNTQTGISGTYLFIERVKNALSLPRLMIVGTPIAAAVVLTFLVKPTSIDSLPEFPMALMSSELPTEDLALLEDLEFVTWLAKNEMDAVL